MPKESVLKMLSTRPMVKKPIVEEGDMASHLFQEFKRDMAERAMKMAEEELQPLIYAANARADAAEARAKTVETERDSIKTLHESMQVRINELMRDLEITRNMNTAISSETRLHQEKSAKAESGMVGMHAKMGEMEKRLSEQKQTIDRLTAELMKPKPVEQPRTVPSIPELNLEVTSRDTTGAIKLVSIKPKGR